MQNTESSRTRGKRRRIRQGRGAINNQLLAENRAKRLRDWKLMLLGAMWAAVVLSLGMCAAFYFAK